MSLRPIRYIRRPPRLWIRVLVQPPHDSLSRQDHERRIGPRSSVAAMSFIPHTLRSVPGDAVFDALAVRGFLLFCCAPRESSPLSESGVRPSKAKGARTSAVRDV